ncbi:MAG: hypothetical protein J6A08_09150 [Lachnospiraceae bacterium]|nr:hypothetical protein [Lachnospiraceae bacterium]
MRESKRVFRIKQYGIWIWMITKRLLRQPMFVVLLVLMPAAGYMVNVLEQEEGHGAVVAVCVEEGEWSKQILSKLRMLSARNRSDGGALQYEFYDSAIETERVVLKSEADCGFVIPEDIARRVEEEDWHNSILVYETASSSITGMAKERIAGVIFQLYSEECYLEYMEETARDEAAQAEYVPEEVAQFAWQAYETHLTDGSTFSFSYEGNDPNSQYNNDTSVGNDTSVFPIKGVFAVFIFISGMCGMLEYEKDKKEKRFERLVPNWVTYIVNVWIPTVWTALAAFICLWAADALQYRASYGAGGVSGVGEALLQVWSPGRWMREGLSLVFYQCVIVLYCVVLRLMLRRRETIAAAIPLLTLGSLICAPVFVRLAMYIPLFRVLEKLFPVTYYLML